MVNLRSEREYDVGPYIWHSFLSLYVRISLTNTINSFTPGLTHETMTSVLHVPSSFLLLPKLFEVLVSHSALVSDRMCVQAENCFFF